MTDSDRNTADTLASMLPAELLPTQTYRPGFGEGDGVTRLMEAIEETVGSGRLLPELRISTVSGVMLPFRSVIKVCEGSAISPLRLRS